MKLIRQLPPPIGTEIEEIRSPTDVDGSIVHVALGKSTAKGALLLKWTASNFVGREICVVHVHRPSESIPTLLGKMPASQANEEVVAAHRKEEWELTKEILKYYESVCLGLKVRMSTMVIQSEQVHKGIVELVNEKGIGKLVMGAAPVTWLNVKSKSKSSYVVKNASRLCEILFINKDKHFWTREATELGHPVLQAVHPITPNPDTQTLNNINLEGFWQKSKFSCGNTKLEDENLCNKLMKVNREVDALTNDASDELLRLKKLEAETQQANKKTNACELAAAVEMNQKREGLDMLRCIKREKDKVLQKIKQSSWEMKEMKACMAILESDFRKAKCEFREASSKLKSIQAATAALRLAKQNLRQQKMDAISRFERLKNNEAEFIDYHTCSGYEDTPQLHVFSLSDVEVATCNFSESFKLGQGQYGCVYKGEIMEQTVIIKQLYPQNMQRQYEFQQEVEALGKLEHPNLVKLLGFCPEAWTLVYDYFPCVSLEDHLLMRNNVFTLTWKVRVRIISQVAQALYFLHSSKPKMIIHGDLKPENILIDSDLSCKVCDYGISSIVSPDSLRCPSFRSSTGPKRALPYSDPEYDRTGILTPKSDIYSLGVIILQLLTGSQKAGAGLIVDLLRAVSDGNVASVLQPTCEEWPSYVARRLVDLGLKFCESNSRDRPALTSTLVKELHRLQFIEDRSVPCYFQCPITKELMHDPQIAADGFSYDGDSLREWLSNGRDTSPMTNLRFSHLHLTPNHSLRKAIQDWVCNS